MYIALLAVMLIGGLASDIYVAKQGEILAQSKETTYFLHVVGIVTLVLYSVMWCLPLMGYTDTLWKTGSIVTGGVLSLWRIYLWVYALYDWLKQGKPKMKTKKELQEVVNAQKKKYGTTKPKKHQQPVVVSRLPATDVRKGSKGSIMVDIDGVILDNASSLDTEIAKQYPDFDRVKHWRQYSVKSILDSDYDKAYGVYTFVSELFASPDFMCSLKEYKYTRIYLMDLIELASKEGYSITIKSCVANKAVKERRLRWLDRFLDDLNVLLNISIEVQDVANAYQKDVSGFTIVLEDNAEVLNAGNVKLGILFNRWFEQNVADGVHKVDTMKQAVECIKQYIASTHTSDVA